MDREEQTKRHSGRALKIILGLSLALNFAVVGLVAGAMLRHEGGQDRGKRLPALSAFGAPYVIALTREDRRKVIGALRAERGQGGLSRHSRTAMYGSVIDALRAEPFEASVLQSAVLEQTQTTVSLQETAQNAWLDIVSDMTVEDRLAYADRIEDVLKRGPGRK